MAKKKYDEVVEPIEEITEDEIVEEAVEEPVETEKVAENDDYEKFIFTQLAVINKIHNPAKAKRLAERVLRNRKGK